MAEQIGLDFQRDTYDAGEHLNHTGAVKLSNYFADILARDHGLADHRQNAETAAIYNHKLKAYDEAIKRGD